MDLFTRDHPFRQLGPVYTLTTRCLENGAAVIARLGVLEKGARLLGYSHCRVSASSNEMLVMPDNKGPGCGASPGAAAEGQREQGDLRTKCCPTASSSMTAGPGG